MALNVLIVDDSATARAVIAKTLSLCGLDLGVVYQAGNGGAALTILAEDTVDLVLADLHMPQMSGIDLVEEMRRTGLLQFVPVVIITAEGSTERIGDLRAQGVSGYLRKPFAREALREVVTDIVGAGHGEVR